MPSPYPKRNIPNTQDYVPQFSLRSPYKNTEGITWRSLASQNSGLQGSSTEVPRQILLFSDPFLFQFPAIILILLKSFSTTHVTSATMKHGGDSERKM